ncbi:hypothetical protein [Streptomyces sp. NPDC050504]|uniref:hypothetical protein n=1 Tax=Streptomyces sp. NPDC050504 TaxID=3365618 RepID=UPI00378B6C8D
MSPDRSQAAYAGSAADLALRALDALRGIGGTAMIAGHAEQTDDPQAALAAIRIVGADAFAPCVLAGAEFHPADAAAVAQSFAVFPPPAHAPAPPPTGPAEPWLAAWRDWATAAMLTRFTEDPQGLATGSPTGQNGSAEGGRAEPLSGTGPGDALAPRPSVAPLLVDTEPGPEGGAEGGRAADGPGAPWQVWSVRMGQLSPLALPGLDGPVHGAARSAPLALARGATRAVLRRDFPTAARITRWLALLAADGVPLPLDPVPLVEHLRLHGGGPRLGLDVAIARRLLALEDA